MEYEYQLDSDGNVWLKKYIGTETVVQVPQTVDGHDVTVIFVSCFAGSPVTQVHIPEGVRTVYGSAFADCLNLTEVTLPDSLTGIYSFAFQNCPSLKKVRLPGNLPQFNRNVFDRASLLADIVEEQDFVCKLYEDGTAAVLYYNCALAERIIIPERVGGHQVTTIARGAFSSYNQISSLFVPASVTKIGHGALPSPGFRWEREIIGYERVESHYRNGTYPVYGNVKKPVGHPIVHLKVGSYAERYCRERSIPYVAEG